MKNVASLFSAEAQKELSVQLNIVLSDEYDYSDDELMDLYARITDEFPYSFDANGRPLRMGRIFEEILNVFHRKNLPI